MEDWRIGVLELVRRILIGLEADESRTRTPPSYSATPELQTPVLRHSSTPATPELDLQGMRGSVGA